MANEEYTKDDLTQILISIRDALQSINQTLNIIIEMAQEDIDVGES